MVDWTPEQHVRVPIVQQGWRSLTFLHHAYPPQVVADLLPPGLEPDTYEGRAWVGVTPFLMRASVLPVLPGPRLPVVEVNVRTYVRDRGGRDGIWFFSLELDQAAVVAGLRGLVRLPYRWARGAIERRGPSIRYHSERRWPHVPASMTLALRVGDELDEHEVGPLETFLVGRWRAYTRVLGQLITVPVEHEPWPLRRAEIVELEEDLLGSAGLPAPADQPHVLFSPGVDARFGLPRPV
jgi:uncharacterized protein